MSDQAFVRQKAETEGSAGQVSILSAQAALPRYFGDPNKGWNDLLDAFEAGTVRTAISLIPTPVGDDLLDRDDVGSRDWWVAYSRDITRANPPMAWVDWFLGGGIVVDVADLRAHVRHKMEEEREFFRNHRRRGLAPSTWTDLEAWAWIASRDLALTEAVGDFVRVEFQNPSNPEYARQMAIEYLQFRVREDFCKCGVELALVEPSKCTCSEASWLKLVEALNDRRLTATTADNDGMQMPVSPTAFRGAVFDWRLRKFLLTGANRELLFARQETEQHFPPELVKQSVEHDHGPITWDDFDPEDLPELERLYAQSLQDEWWTWPEAIAWIGSRDTRNVATLRFLGGQWLRRSEANAATITAGTQAYLATHYCTSGREAEGELHRAIERGALGTIGRSAPEQKSSPLPKEDWRGGKVVYSEGVAVLVSAANPLIVWAYDVGINRSDLVREFPESACVDTDVARAPLSLESPNAEWIELWQGPLIFRATNDRGKFGPGHTLERIHQFADDGASANGTQIPFYRVRVDPADGAIYVEWIGSPMRNGEFPSIRYYEGLGRGLYERLRNEPTLRDQHFRTFPILPEQYERAVGAIAIALSIQEWLRSEFFNAIHAGDCEIWARMGSKLASFTRIPADVFRNYNIRSWGFGLPGGAWAELEGAPTLYAIYVARGPEQSVCGSDEPLKRQSRRGRTKGAGSLANVDAPLLEEMRQLIAGGRAFSAHGAAKLVAHKAKGGGTEESRATRLASRYRAENKSE